MNRQQVEQNIGEVVRLDAWPKCPVIIRGCEITPFGVGERWILNKLTKGGMAMITCQYLPVTIGVPPFYISELK